MLFAWIPLYQIFFFKLSGIFQDLSQPVGFCRETIYGAEAWHLEKVCSHLFVSENHHSLQLCEMGLRFGVGVGASEER